MKHDHIKRWNFICSYGGILFSGIIVYLILLAIYLIVRPAEYTVSKTLTMFPRVFLIWTMPVLLIMTLLLFLSNIVLIFHEHFGYRRLLGTVFGLACIAGNLLCRRFLFTSLIGGYIGIIFIGTSVMGAVAIRNKPELDNDFLIILGCYIGKKGMLMPLIRSRLNRAIHFAWEQEIATGKAIRYVPSGGKGRDEIMSEGSAMALYLLSHGAEDYEILPEKESKNTYENMLFSKRIIDSEMPGAKIAYITTNYHILRSGMLAKKAGLNSEGLASTTKWYFWPNGYIREFIAILFMHKKTQAAALAVCVLLTLILQLVR